MEAAPMIMSPSSPPFVAAPAAPAAAVRVDHDSFDECVEVEAHLHDDSGPWSSREEEEEKDGSAAVVSTSKPQHEEDDCERRISRSRVDDEEDYDDGRGRRRRSDSDESSQRRHSHEDEEGDRNGVTNGDNGATASAARDAKRANEQADRDENDDDDLDDKYEEDEAEDERFFLVNSSATYDDVVRSSVAAGMPRDLPPVTSSTLRHAERLPPMTCRVRREDGGGSEGGGSEAAEVKAAMRALCCTDRAYAFRREAHRGGFGCVMVCNVLRGLSRHEPSDDIDDNEGGGGDGSGSDDGASAVEWEMTSERAAVKIVPRAHVDTRTGELLDPDPLDEVAATLHAMKYSPELSIDKDVPDKRTETEKKKEEKMRVVGVLDVLIDYDYVYVVMPYLPGKELYEHIVDRGSLNETEARRIFVQILEGVAQLRRAGLAHMDLSPENVLLNNEGECTLIDLGSCLRVPQGFDREGTRSLLRPMPLVSKVGYVPPEVLHCTSTLRPFDAFGVDLWAAAVTLFVMLAGREAWKSPEHKDFRYGIVQKKGARALLGAWDVDVTETCADLLDGMLREDPAERLTFAEVVEHPWVMEGRTR